MKYVITAVVMALAIAATASAAYPTKPNYLRGPICANHHTGVMRWVKASQACKKHEVRLMVPKSPRSAAGLPGVAGPQGAQGAQGAAGAKGDTGAQGAAGATGADGAVGPQGEPGAAGQTGATGAAGNDGAPGAKGATGDQGPAGPAGPQGATGPQGPAGQSGLGTSEVYACISNGSDWKWGGEVDGTPDCNTGHDQILKVVVDTTP
jgi:hypothetical protein